MKESEVLHIIETLRNYYGEQTSDLAYSSIYELTIAVVLSAQTTDKQVNSVTPRLFKEYPHALALSRAKLKDIEEIVKPTGFYRNKAANIIGLAKGLVERFNSEIPATMDELISLPGVGRKSANVILSLGHNKQALAVDTHVMRIGNRLGFTTSKNPDIVERDITSLVPEDLWIDTHMFFIRHGRSLCTARSPQCSQCPLLKECPWAVTSS